MLLLFSRGEFRASLIAVITRPGPFAVACVDYRHTPASQCGLYIGEVEVNLPRSIHHVRDATCGIAEGVVCLLEGVIHRVVRINLYEALVVDDKEGVHTLSHLLHPIESL